MSSYQYERLSAQDNDFLVWETPELPMHVAGAQIFRAGPLRNADGGIDFEKIKRLTESVLHRIPRYRQKLAWIPGEDHAVWIDDDKFNLDYHFRHTSLPRPGTDDQLKRLVARLMEHPLDRSRPLWETWIVEGLQGDRFATLNKLHHCMVDGASGVDLAQLLLSRTPQTEIRSAPRFIPRPAPKPRDLQWDERFRKLGMPIRTGMKLLETARDSRDLRGDISRRMQTLVGLSRRMIFRASPTPINGAIGPHRIVDWAEMSLADVKAVRRALNCSVNDVVLATATGAFRKLMQRRQVDPAKLDFRVSTPVNVRTAQEQGASGNYVSSWVVRLPLELEDPLAQIEAICQTTAELKASDEAGVVKMVINAIDALGFNVQRMSVGTMNTIVTNVPGPPFPLYLLGAELEQMVPFAPLIENLGLATGVLSYNGRVFWGMNADADRLPDLADFRLGIERSFARLAEAAGVRLGGTELAAGGQPEVQLAAEHEAVLPQASEAPAVPPPPH